jgi:hypothetical protein
MFFIGGIGRWLALATVGHIGDRAMMGGLALERGVVPLLVLWHRRVASSRDV